MGGICMWEFGDLYERITLQDAIERADIVE